MIKQIYTKIILALFCLLPAFAYANFTVTPVKLMIKKDEKIATLTLKNNADQLKTFQLIVYKKEMEGGKEVFKESKDLMVTPVIFKVAGGKTQLIRLAIKNAMYNHQEDGYRLSVRELPHKAMKSGSNVNFVTEFRVPVSVDAAAQTMMEKK